MPLKTLEHLAGKMSYETLPANWNTFDLQRFSEDKQLWDYQQKALKLALVALYKYYEEFLDYEPQQNDSADKERKQKLADWYDLGMALSTKERKALDLDFRKAKLPLRQLLEPYYTIDEEAPRIDFKEVCNRMSFWMATGSGKTIVLVKLLEILHLLIQRGELPERDILFLTCREDLIDQFRQTVQEFNRSPANDLHIDLRELREYPELKRERPGGLLGRDSTLRVFFYRSDNLSDEHKELIVDFRNYDNEGKWFILLDEAHKGDSADSKRKQIFSILSRMGFLFNFSATFTDTIDLTTTVHNFNLSEFIERGYGKHLTVLKQELAAFKKDQSDYSDEEKRKIVAKSMLLLAFTAKKVREIRSFAGSMSQENSTEGNAPSGDSSLPASLIQKLYHHPMLLALVNSVNTDDADLKLYFEQILAIGRGKVATKVWDEAKQELWLELKEQPALLYEDRRTLAIAKEDITSLSVVDVWRDVYNFESTRGGEIEVLIRPGNRKEIAFKMKTSEKPFALIKIGDVTEWLKEHLADFEYSETLETDSFFKGLNAPNSPINILMGSRSFYEGWDSHRPNVINFVNIGTGETAKKFIMQSVGRGVRVRSWGGARQRLEELVDVFDDKNLFRSLRELSIYPETLYILGTNRDALNVVLGNLKEEKLDMQLFLDLQLNPEVEKHLLLIPRYLENGTPIVDTRMPTRFELTESDFELTQSYSRYMAEDSTLLLTHGGTPRQIKQFRDSLANDKAYYSRYGNRSYRNLEVLVGRVMDYFNLKARELDTFSKVEAGKDIVHFSKMSVDKAHAEQIQRKIDGVLYSRSDKGKADAEQVWKEVGQLELDFSEKALEVSRLMEDRGLTGRQYYQDDICIDGMEYLARHFYLPIVYSTGRRVDYLRHIIQESSEVDFLEDFKKYVGKKGNRLSQLNWWMFSKLDEYLDISICIPYYDPKQNKVRSFVPDFIFWASDGNSYRIVFVDPKGMMHEDWRNKLAGYKRLFEEDNKPKIFSHGDQSISVHLCLYNRRRDQAAEGDDKRFWFDNPQTLFETVFSSYD